MTGTTTPSPPPATPAPSPARALTALWLACLAAMALGLWADTRQTPAALLASECGAPGSLWDMAWRHATLMPVSSAAMVLAALAPWPRGHAQSAGRRLLCAAFMAIGMVLGARLGAMAALAYSAPPFAGMVIGMAAGMAAGLFPMALSARNGALAGGRKRAG